MTGFFEQSGYTGGLMEREVLGGLRLKKEDIYVPFREAMKWVEEHQPGDPADPDPRFANDLHATVAEMLGIKDFKNIEFFTAVGSPLDTFHGIDAFFKIKEGGEELTVTLDVTINPAKGDRYKADVVFFMPPDGLDPREDKKLYLEKINEVAAEIVDRVGIIA